MQDGVVVDELHVTGPEVHLQAQFLPVRYLLKDIECFFLHIGQREFLAIARYGFHEGAVGDTRCEFAVARAEHGDVIPGLFAVGMVAAPVDMKRLVVHVDQVGALLEQHIVHRVGAHEVTGAAGFRCAHAEQAQHVDGKLVAVEIEAIPGLVAARVRIGEGLAFIRHVTQQVAAAILADRGPDMGTDTPIDQAAFLIGITIARDAADQDHTKLAGNPVHQLVETCLECRNGKDVGRERDMATGCLRRLERGVDFLQFLLRQFMEPARVILDIRPGPGVRCCDFFTDDFNHVRPRGRSFRNGFKIYRECVPGRKRQPRNFLSRKISIFVNLSGQIPLPSADLTAIVRPSNIRPCRCAVRANSWR